MYMCMASLFGEAILLKDFSNYQLKLKRSCDAECLWWYSTFILVRASLPVLYSDSKLCDVQFYATPVNAQAILDCVQLGINSLEGVHFPTSIID